MKNKQGNAPPPPPPPPPPKQVGLGSFDPTTEKPSWVKAAEEDFKNYKIIMGCDLCKHHPNKAKHCNDFVPKKKVRTFIIPY
jgi:hypothetical protein